MQIFEKIQNLLTKSTPFACYLKPNESKWNLLWQESEELISFCGQSGFVFAPFNAGEKVVIPFNELNFHKGDFDCFEVDLSNSSFPQTDSIQKENFEKLVSNGVSAIRNGEFQKVVLSRKIVFNESISEVETFKNLVVTYSTAFRYLFYHPKVGLWMGATPEQLLKINKNHFETVALAGTQLHTENIVWNKKEIEEQQFVTDFIVDSIKSKVQNLKISDVKTIKAGNLAHLKSLISGELGKNYQAIELLEDLHPTPAVCGLPMNESKKFILAHENYNRKYYSGFLGEWNSEIQTDLYVNLRCLEIEKNNINLYVGCGITKDSNPEKEFFETENKSLTMRNVLAIKKGLPE